MMFWDLVDLCCPSLKMLGSTKLVLSNGTQVWQRQLGRHKLATMKRMVAAYHLDGVLLHSDRSCKPYSLGQIDQRERLSAELCVPALLLDADHNDPRAFSEAQISTRLGAFLEIIGT